MFPLAHLGIGSAVTRLFEAKFEFRWVSFGTLLPDLVDKPTFLLLGRCCHDAGWEAGKRGVAHTLVFLALLACVSAMRRSPAFWATTAGVATHLALDVISKCTEGRSTAVGSLQVLFWPLGGWRFTTLSHGMHGIEIWIFEMAGLGLLVLQFVLERRNRP
jgi:LexA-binding, inner membrane-associated putative hydrolase